MPERKSAFAVSKNTRAIGKLMSGTATSGGAAVISTVKCVRPTMSNSISIYTAQNSHWRRIMMDAAKAVAEQIQSTSYT
jgi:hypothetical protein